jgi:tellurite resistance protein TerC
MSSPASLWILFCVLCLGVSAIDLFVVTHRVTEIQPRTALKWTALWCAVAGGFGVAIWWLHPGGGEIAAQYFAGYLTEYSLSADNLLVFILIFALMGVEPVAQPKLIKLGIYLSIALRLVCIFFGIALIERLHWLIYALGALLIWAAWKMVAEDEPAELRPEKNLLYRFAARFVRVHPEPQSALRLIARHDGRLAITSLFLVVLVIGSTDVLFAMDSIPAITGISQDRFVVVTSNAFAVLGLNSLFFAVRGVARLKFGISVVLFFIGAKMLASVVAPVDAWFVQRPWLPLLFIVVVLAMSLGRDDKRPPRKLLWRVIPAGLAVLVAAMIPDGIARVNENQVGVMVDNLRGRITLQEREGIYLFWPYLRSFYVLDKTIHRLDLVWAETRGATPRELKLRTADGSSVSLDVTVSYKVVPREAVEVLRRAGTGERFGEVWVEPFARHVCMTSFGRLTTEEMYDAGRRSERAREALHALNELLQQHGIDVIALIPGEFRFYQEYERVIQEKKLADQQVEEQQSQAKALLQVQARELVDAEHRALTEITTTQGQSVNRLIHAGAEADQIRREADGYFTTKTFQTDGAFATTANHAKGRRALLLADAEGMDQRRQALIGQGGVNLVGLEYAKRLAGVRFSGTPIAREPLVQQFSVPRSTGENTPPSAQSASPTRPIPVQANPPPPVVVQPRK